MRLSYDKDGDLFILKLSAAEKHIPKALGFVVCKERRKWVTDDPITAAKLIEHADDSAKEALNVSSPSMESVVASHASDCDYYPPVPDGWALLAFQRAGVEYTLPRADTLIADQPGLGKSPQSVVVANTIENLTSTLIICPASLKRNWEREWNRWTIHSHLSVGIANGKYFPNTDVVIINYDILHNWEKELRLRVWDLLICDEAHALKTKGTRRTAHVLGGQYETKVTVNTRDGKTKKKKKRIKVDRIRARKRVFLSGTPMLSRPIDLWPLAEACDPTDLGRDWYTFTRRYCAAWDAPWGYDTSGASNLDELQHKLRSKFMIRRTKEQVLKELPPKRRQIIEFPAEGAKRLLDREIQMYERFSGLLETVPSPPSPGDKAQPREYEDAVAGLVGPEQEIALEDFALLRQEVALKKLPMAVEFINELLEAGEKVIVFAYHKAVINELRVLYPQAACISGDVPQHKRQDQVDKFQNEPECNVFIGQHIAAGTGHTLTASSHVVFVELDWTPGNMEQCEDRAHRIGQEAASVNIYHLVLEGSLDARMIESLIEKQKVIEAALG